MNSTIGIDRLKRGETNLILYPNLLYFVPVINHVEISSIGVEFISIHQTASRSSLKVSGTILFIIANQGNKEGSEIILEINLAAVILRSPFARQSTIGDILTYFYTPLCGEASG